MSSATVTTRHERKQIRRQVDRLLAGVDVPNPFDITTFCMAITRQRGRRIALVPTSGILGDRLAPFSGLWIAGPSADFLFYDDSTSQLHWENSVLHELGHLLFDHRPHGTISDDELTLLQLLLPGLSVERLKDIVGGALGRAGYTHRQEREAELFAARVWQRAGRTLVISSRRHASESETLVLRRLAEALGPDGFPR
jgi:hypothetical protein